MTIRTATATIDLKALVDNLSVIKTLAPDSKVLAVLKANAYGHGLERIAKALHQADAFGVARIDEAVGLRASGIDTPIVLLEGFFSKEDLPFLAVNNIQTVVHNREQLDAILTSTLEIPLKVWLKIDTGMHRLGVDPYEYGVFYQKLTYSKNVKRPVIIMSHLACADEENNASTRKQIAFFDELTEMLHEEKSLANSAAIFAWPQSHKHWVRPGLSLYGVSPMTPLSHPLNAEINQKIKPVMTLQSSVIAIRKIGINEAVGYGATWVSEKPTTIGVIAIGYGDGYPRHAVNGTPVLLNGRIVPLIGRVSMDMITVDLGEDSTDMIGDVATLWGNGLPVEKVAEFASTIPYELLCNITRRVQIEVN